MKIAVVYALPDRQIVRELEVAAGTTLAEALECSGLPAEFPEISLQTTPVGVYGRLAAGDTVLRDGDRVEIYRPLKVEPKTARRQRLRKA